MSSTKDTAPLEADIAMLTARLDATIAELSDPSVLELVRSLRDDAIALRKRYPGGGREHFHQRIAALNVEQLADVARAFTQWFHLVNAAEEQHRVRLLRRHDPRAPARGLDGQRARRDGASRACRRPSVRAQLERLFVMPVLTAHPTEARRRTVRDHVAEVKRLLDGLERPRGRARARRCSTSSTHVMALYGTEESRVTKPTPRDELEAGLDVFKRTLLDATPAALPRDRGIPGAPDARGRLARAPPSDGGQWVIPSFLRWGTWIGGDRDGNPFVTAHVTRTVLERQRASILDRYLSDVDALGRALSLSSRRDAQEPRGSPSSKRRIARDRERFPEIAARVQQFTVLRAVARKALVRGGSPARHQEPGRRSLRRSAGYQRDLVIIERALVASGSQEAGARACCATAGGARTCSDSTWPASTSGSTRACTSGRRRAAARAAKLDDGKSYADLDEAGAL